MKAPIKAVRLPTDDSELGSALFNTVYMHSENKSLVIGYLNARSTKHVPHHIYITIPQEVEDIKVGDWFINDTNDYIGIGLCQLITNKDGWSCTLNTPKVKGHYVAASIDYLQKEDVYRKIIATDDPKLYRKKVYRISDKGETLPQDERGTYEWVKHIPQPQQSFIEEFVANPDGEWEVEYEIQVRANTGISQYENWTTVSSLLAYGLTGVERKNILKLNQDNEVTITSVEEKM
jgi:hypothetical protein|tara:strand:- start:266 stop:967 length:702 start_codon:yes stop_codon:yes gene_type:complete